jgi:hypothetical protein
VTRADAIARYLDERLLVMKQGDTVVCRLCRGEDHEHAPTCSVGQRLARVISGVERA